MSDARTLPSDESSKRIPIKELMRLAFIHAETDREGFAEAWGHDSLEGRKALELAKQLREYRLKRWGQTQLEADLKDAKLISVYKGMGVESND